MDSNLFPDDTAVHVRFPLTREQHHGDREAWPWLPGTITKQCGPDEWQVCVEDRRVAVRKDGSKPTPCTPQRNLCYPLCFRDASEIRVWPVACYVGCLELLAWMREHLSASARAARSAPARTAPDASQASVPDALPDAPSDELKDRRERKTRQPVADLLKAAEAAFADRTSVPSLRDVQGAMSIGQGKAQQVQRHLKTLQAATG
jgi:hypothetical protein